MRLSLSGGSGLSIRDLIFCPQKFKYIKEGYKEKNISIPLAEGIIFHDCAEKILNDGDLDIKEVQEALKAGKYVDSEKREIMFDINAKLKESNKETRVEKASRRLPGMLEKLMEAREDGDFDGLVGTEEIVEISELVVPEEDVFDKKTNKIIKDYGLSFSGKLDVVFDRSFGDLKTASSSSRWTQERADGELQFTLYSYMKTLETGDFWDTAYVYEFTKHMPKRSEDDKVSKGCQYAKIETKRTEREWDIAYRTLRQAAKMYAYGEEEEWERLGPLNGGCMDNYFQLCPFHALCFPEKYTDEQRDELLDNIYKEEENAGR